MIWILAFAYFLIAFTASVLSYGLERANWMNFIAALYEYRIDQPVFVRKHKEGRNMGLICAVLTLVFPFMLFFVIFVLGEKDPKIMRLTFNAGTFDRRLKQYNQRQEFYKSLTQ